MSVWLAVILTVLLAGGFFTALIGFAVGWDWHEVGVVSLGVVGIAAAAVGLVALLSVIWNAVLS